MLDSAKNMKKYVQILAWTNTRHRIPNIPRTKAKTDIPTLLHVSKASHNGVKTFLERKKYVNVIVYLSKGEWHYYAHVVKIQ